MLYIKFYYSDQSTITKAIDIPATRQNQAALWDKLGAHRYTVPPCRITVGSKDEDEN